MLDLHALYDSTGSTTLANAFLIPANDGQTAAGVPIAPGAILKGWSVATTIADTLREVKMLSQDQIDSINGEYWIGGTASVAGLWWKDSYLPYTKGGRAIYIRQNTGAAPCLAATVDQYSTPGGANIKNFGQQILLPQVFSGALTAVTWGSQPVSPTVNIPAGKYGLLGAYTTALTNYAYLRFAHADFGGKKPGFPTVDASKAVARAVAPYSAPLFNYQGTQFLALGDVPIFNATSTGTGLTIDAISITADTPQVMLNLVQLA